MKIYFDLDGTLIDSKQRLYQLFQFLVPQSRFTFSQYWDLKRNAINHSQILSLNFRFSNPQIQEFEHDWMNLIEEDDWLILDEPFTDTSTVLRKLSNEGHELYVVTARQSAERVDDQIIQFGWKDYFADVLVTRQKVAKTSLIRPTINFESIGWIVGDTGKDIETGKKLKLKTAAVLTGFLGKRILDKYGPDQIVERLNQLKF